MIRRHRTPGRASIFVHESVAPRALPKRPQKTGFAGWSRSRLAPQQAGSPKGRSLDLPRRRRLAGVWAAAGQDWIENARPGVGAGTVPKKNALQEGSALHSISRPVIAGSHPSTAAGRACRAGASPSVSVVTYRLMLRTSDDSPGTRTKLQHDRAARPKLI